VGVEAVAAQVHQRAAGQLQRPAWVIVGGGGDDQVDLDLTELAQLAGGQQPVQAAGHRVVEVVEALQQGHAGRGGGVADLTGLLGVAGRGFLAQHVLAGGDRGQVPGAVEAVGERVVDDLDLGVGRHVDVGIQHPLDAVGGSEGLGPAPVAGGDRDDAVAGGVGGVDDGDRGDPGRAQDADPQRFRRLAVHHRDSRRTDRRYSALAHTSATGPSPRGSSVRMVSCSSTYQPW
jgi:hypothetical protein